ncbi:MAG: hypothetical protein R3B57_14485 [Phycisphaerales bacterium]
MSETPRGAIRVARAAAGRIRLRRTLVVLGRLLAISAFVALVLVVLERLGVLDAPRWALLATPFGVGILLSVAVGMARRISPASAAGVVDEALALRDRLRSALELANSPRGEDPAFVALSVAESERVAPQAQIRRAIPLRWEWTWGAWAATLALAVTLAAALPRRETGAVKRDTVTLADRERAAESLAETAELVRELASKDPELDDASPDELEAIESLESELSEGRGDPEQAITESADALERLADEMDEQAEQRAMERDEFERLAQGLESESASPEVQRLAEALKAADLERAREAARDLMNMPQGATPAERERLAQDLERLAEQLDELASHEGESETPLEAPEPTGDEAPPPNQPEGTTPPGADQPHPDQAPEESPPPSEQSPDASPPAETTPPDPIREQAEKREAAREQAERDARDLSDALRNAADEARRREQESQRPSEGDRSTPEADRRADEGTQRQEQSKPSDQGEPKPGSEPGETQKPQPQPGSTPQPEPEPGASETPSKDQPPNDAGDPPVDQQPSDRPPEQPQGEPNADDGQPQGEPNEGEKPGAGKDGATPPDTPSDQRPGEGEGSPTSQDRPGEGNKSAPPTDRPGQSPSPGESRPSLDEQLRRLSDRQGAPTRQRETAQRLRDRAQELLGDTPERQLPPDGGAGGAEDPTHLTPPGDATTPTSTEPVDARPPTGERPDDVREQVVADWYSEDKLQRDPNARQQASERLQDAARSAERAVEQQRVPRRYRDLIRRLNERYQRRAGDLPNEPAPLGQDADTSAGGGSP